MTFRMLPRLRHLTSCTTRLSIRREQGETMSKRNLAVRTVLTLVCLTGLLLPLNVKPTSAQAPTSIPQQDAQRKRAQKEFESGRAMLKARGVPFEPNDLLEPGWRHKLAPVFATMPELN